MVPATTIVVCEKRPRWTPELQRQFLEDDVHVRGCRSIDDVESICRDLDAQPLILDFEIGAAECLQFLGRYVGTPLLECVIVIGSRPTADLEWSVRELGALEFVPEFISGSDLARICRRQFGVTRPLSIPSHFHNITEQP